MEAWELLLQSPYPSFCHETFCQKSLEFIRLFSIFSVATVVQATNIFARRVEWPWCSLCRHYCLPWHLLFHSQPLIISLTNPHLASALHACTSFPLPRIKAKLIHKALPSPAPVSSEVYVPADGNSAVTTNSFSVSGFSFSWSLG